MIQRLFYCQNCNQGTMQWTMDREGLPVGVPCPCCGNFGYWMQPQDWLNQFQATPYGGASARSIGNLWADVDRLRTELQAQRVGGSTAEEPFRSIAIIRQELEELRRHMDQVPIGRMDRIDRLETLMQNVEEQIEEVRSQVLLQQEIAELPVAHPVSMTAHGRP